MKLPKFMKSSSSISRAGKRGGDEKNGGGRQILITELNFQPHKNAAAIMNFDKSLYMTPRGLNTAMMTTPKPTAAAAGRYVKSAQTKRLQRTPKCYVSSSTATAAVSSRPQTTTPISSYMFTTNKIVIENKQIKKNFLGH